MVPIVQNKKTETFSFSVLHYNRLLAFSFRKTLFFTAYDLKGDKTQRGKMTCLKLKGEARTCIISL